VLAITITVRMIISTGTVIGAGPEKGYGRNHPLLGCGSNGENDNRNGCSDNNDNGGEPERNESCADCPRTGRTIEPHKDWAE